MIKALGTGPDGVPTLLLGLSRANCTRMLAGDPILVEGAKLGVKGLNVLLCAGLTEAALVDELEHHKLLPADVARRMRAGHQLMDDVPAARGDEMRYDGPGSAGSGAGG